MHLPKYLLPVCLYALFISPTARAQTGTIAASAERAMLNATVFMFDKVSTDGGFVWYYTTDLSRRWGEMEAFKSMIWVQGGTVAVGNTVLDAYRATNNEYFYRCAEKVAAALIKGQSPEGGWNYMIDFAGENSLKHWYITIGKNGWRLEEFQLYYGNDTYDDDVSSGAARFLLRMYVQKKNQRYKAALDKAVDFVLKSQYPAGGWPQRYPLKYDFIKSGRPDYSSYYTFNDDVIGENIKFLIQCYQLLGDKRFLDPIRRGMDFYLLAQQTNGAWGQQYNMKMEPAGARSYEPAALLPSTTAGNCRLLMKFYQYTGDRKYLAHIPKAIEWLEKVKLPDIMSAGGRYSHPLYVESGSDKPIFVHRKGSNVKFGFYYTNYEDTNLLAHMFGKRFIDVKKLREEYAAISALPITEATKNSPLKQTVSQNSELFTMPDEEGQTPDGSEAKVKEIITLLDTQGRWLTKHVSISNPYAGDGRNKEASNDFASTQVGDLTDTSPYRDLSDTEYISTPLYIRNMRTLIQSLNSGSNNTFNSDSLPKSIVWKIDNLNRIGRQQTTVLGQPVVIKDQFRTSVLFNGVNDGIVIPQIPMQGWKKFTIEVLFKPSGDGPVAPRFIHFTDDSLNRGTFEVRLTPARQWYLDTFLKNGKTGDGLTLIDSTLLHPSDKWYWVAFTYDGLKMTSYVNGVKELEGNVDLPPLLDGKLSLGVRLNQVAWFKGFISELRFHPEVLSVNALAKEIKD